MTTAWSEGTALAWGFLGLGWVGLFGGVFLEGIDPLRLLNASMVVTTFLSSILQNCKVILNILLFWGPWESYSGEVDGMGIATSRALCV